MASSSANRDASQGLAPCPFTSATPSFTPSTQSPNPVSTDGYETQNPINAFEGLATSTSAFGRSKMRVKKVPYDVFINHRGPDVKKGLATALYNTLNGLGLRVFLDSKELEWGDSFPQEIEEAIRSASLHIAIFSKNYAQSRWCLAELLLMLKTGTQIVPVFYHVQPEVVRHTKGVYAEAFSRHEETGRHTPEELQQWKDALRNVSHNVGPIINTEEDETKLLKNIANCAVKVIKNVSFVVAKHPVGIDEAVQDFEITILQSAEDRPTVKIVGIWGMGGLGKTTLVKKLFNIKYKTVEKCSFLLDVRDAAHRSVLHIKQKKLLEDLGFKNENVENVEEGKGILARHLRSVRVLIVLDDVDSVDQLDALVPEKDNLRSGSLIVVTSRHFDVLTSWGIPSSSVYRMKRLDPSHSVQLFCWHAFLQPFPKDGFAKLVEKFIHACDGLPLSLKVFGGQLYGKSEQGYWESQLEKIARILPGDIINSLKVSYDALDNEEKEAFLDAACFFIGEQKSLAIEVWNGSDGSGSGLCSCETLINRCLIEINEMDCIRMHDHLRDLGRSISYEQSPHRLYHPEVRWETRPAMREIRRLPSSVIFSFMNFEKEKRINIRGIMATSNRLEWHLGSTRNIRYRFRMMVEPDGSSRQDSKVLFNTSEGIWTLSPSLGGLKIFVVSGDNLNQVIGEASRELVWLRWFPAEQRYLPSRLSLKNLRVLEIYENRDGEEHHLQKLWKHAGDAPIQLRELVISGCSQFQRFPKSIGSLKLLRKIVVEQKTYDEGWGSNLKCLPRDFCLLKSLEHLKLCCQLSSLPDNFGDLRNLRYLYLSGCHNLRRLPVSFKGLTLLQHLHLEGFFELTLEPDIMKDMTKLEYFNLFDCRELEELPHHITDQPSLTELHLSTKSLREIPVKIGQLSKLQKLFISSELLTSLPPSLGDLCSLTSLELRRCLQLKSLPNSLGDLSSLAFLSLSECPKLEFLPNSLGSLSSLNFLSLRRCSNMESLPDSLGDLSSLTDLEICDFEKLESLPDSVGRLSLLERLKINDSRVNALSKSVRELNNLQYLEISNCPISEFDLGSGPFVSPLCKLKWIYLCSTQVSKISISEDCCPRLESLSLCDNSHLTDIQVLPNTLECILLRGCPELGVLPSVAQFASLQEFELSGCNGVKKLQGSEHSTALEGLTAERLRRLQLIAISRSVIQPYIQTVKKLPEEEIVVCMRALPNAASLVNSAFQNLSVLASLNNRKIAHDRSCKLMQRCSPTGDAIIVCFVINCVTPRMLLELCALHLYPAISEAEIEEGKWVWLAIFTKRSEWWAEDGYEIASRGLKPGKAKVEKALVGVGEHSRVMETFWELWGRLPE